MERPEKDEIQNWLHHPVGQWFLSELEVEASNNTKRFLQEEEAAALYRTQGYGRLLMVIKEMLNA